MYEEFFGLQRRPFSATPDANCFVPLESHQGVLDALAVSCERGQGIGVLTGEAGLGKSLVGLRLAFELQPTFATAFLGHSAYATRRALLQAILFELNRPYERMAEQELRLELAATLKSLRTEKQGFVLIVDEAHRLNVPLLDEVRLLTLLADGGEPLARAVLIGDRDLEERLVDPELAPFNQRVCCQVDLAPLTQAESLEYLRANLEFAGASAEEVFTDEALTFLAKAADGVPRCLNHLADHSLLLAFVTERRPVSVEVVREALDDLKQLPLHWNDPVNGGEIYRGRSQSPTMEDSAVDLWPQQTPSVDVPSRETSTWDESAFEGSSAAIEIGGELDEPIAESHEQVVEETEQLTCLKVDWRSITRDLTPIEDLLANVTELAQEIIESQGSPTLGQVFDAREFEFGAPSPRSFAVEEFAAESRDSDEDRWTPRNDDDATESVWNLPERTWSSDEDRVVEFEEEPVIDRYVKMAGGSRIDGIVWGHPRPHAQTAAARTATAVKTTRLVTAAASTDDSSEANEAQEFSESQESPDWANPEASSGIVESYSRRPRDVRPVEGVPDQAHGHSENDDPGHVEIVPHEGRDWNLPSELLQATLADDGIEEQIGADVLDMYLDVQQSLIDRQLASARPASSQEPPKREELSAPITAEEVSREADFVSQNDRDSEPSRTVPTDAIQRAYGRLFSELRRKKR
ncbi:MAG: ATPase AAA [Planctomycetota bacterium]|nr:MAG: ATPase AAA [Planctomycetota bacterium]